jgi:hypothetical protein
MYKKLLIVWLVASIFLISTCLYIYDTNWFFPIVVCVFISFILLTLIKTRSLKLVSFGLLGGLTFSVLSTVSFLDNYMRAQVENQDGIAVTNTLSYLYFGEDGWSIELFRSGYEMSFSISMSLFILYVLVLFYVVYSNREKASKKSKKSKKSK